MKENIHTFLHKHSAGLTPIPNSTVEGLKVLATTTMEAFQEDNTDDTQVDSRLEIVFSYNENYYRLWGVLISTGEYRWVLNSLLRLDTPESNVRPSLSKNDIWGGQGLDHFKKKEN